MNWKTFCRMVGELEEKTMTDPKPLAAPLSRKCNCDEDAPYHYGDCPTRAEVAAPLPEPTMKHACPEWDFMEIDETWPEFEACLCFKKSEIANDVKGENMENVEVYPNDGPIKGYKWKVCIGDITAAFTGSKELADGIAKQLKENGYVEDPS